MGSRGPTKKPEQRRAIQTDRKKRRRKGAESPKPKGEAWLKCPQDLKGVARAEWNRLAAELARQGLLGVLDLTPFKLYCVAYKNWTDFETQSTKVGPEASVQLGYRNAADRALQNLLRLSARFGLDPASRENVVANPPTSEEDKTADPERARFFGGPREVIAGGKK